MPSSFPQLVERSAEQFGSKVFLPRRHSRGGDPTSFAALAAEVRAVAAGLASLGLQHGQRVALMSENSATWLATDLAVTYLGAVGVPRGADTTPAEMRFILEHSGSQIVFAETDRLATELLRYRDELPQLAHVCVLAETTEVAGAMGLAELRERGATWEQGNAGVLGARSAQVGPDDLLTIVYTSGTTAEPKGVMLTHRNVLSNVHTTTQVLNFVPSDRFLSALPPWHMYERMMDYTALAAGAELVYTDRRRLKEDLRAIQPTLFAAVPRIWESIHDGIINHCEKLAGAKRALMKSVLSTCRRVGAGQPRLLDRLTHLMLRGTLLRRFRAATGGQLRVAVSGGGALPAHVDEMLLGLGIPICNGYGLTETSPVVALRTPRDNRCGTIGRPLPQTEVQIRDEQGHTVDQGQSGLIWIRGPGVMRGYFNNPTTTANVLQEGWFNSGDLGSIDRDGHIRITGRAKDTIVLAGGENVEPEPLEIAVKTSPLIEQAVVLGQDRKSLGALLVVDTTYLEEKLPRDQWALDGPLITAPAVHDLLRQELNRHLCRGRGFRPFERVSTFRVLHEPMTPENDLLTQTLKVRRHVVADRFGALIDEMFER
ncbi:MAG: long-chain fatty acid--CoA ligase [Planctomycetota bacterium]